MTRIYKYRVAGTMGENLVKIPPFGKVIHAGLQGSDLFVWALVNPSLESVETKIFVYGTGHDIPEASNKRFISTIFDGPFVWHVFVEKS